MTQEQIIEGNRLIANFLGKWIIEPEEVKISEDQMFSDELQYHLSFAYLMPVLLKIESLGYKTIIGGGDEWGDYCNIMYGLSISETSDTKALGKGGSKIEAIYSAVIQFITWLNDKK